MEQIAAGKGRNPERLSCWADVSRVKADAVWHSNRQGSAGGLSSASWKTKEGPSQKTWPCHEAMEDAEFIAPQLCKQRGARTGRRRLGARDQARWLPHAAADRGRRRPSCARAKASTGHRSSRRSPMPPRACPTASSTVRSSRSTTTARRISPPCRPRCPKGVPATSSYFVFDLLFADGEDLRGLPLTERKARLAGTAAPQGQARGFHQVCRASRRARRCRTAIGLPHAISKASSPKRSDAPYRLRAHRQLGQGQMPGGP